MAILFLALIVVVVMIVNTPKIDESNHSIPNSSIGECNIDSDCIPDSCCHASACVSKNQYALRCDNTLCTMECAPNTLDCGQGSCKCINSKCLVEFD